MYLLYLVFRESRGLRVLDKAMSVSSVIMILVSIWLDIQVDEPGIPLSFLTIAITVSCVFYYIWLHLQFVREHEEDLKARQRIRIMISQIQPHFLYNTLSSIQALCYKNPEKAAEITGDFSAYLRQNLSFLNEPGLIPFGKALEHTKSYVKIEETRFPNIHVQYDIQDSDFSLPPLTLQPIVENAIRHGVRVREEGIIEIVTRKRDDWHEILIRDNGKGFDVKKLEEADETHIGLRNVRDRVKSMCGGSLTVDSQLGVGTTLIIRIPPPQEINGREAGL
ncbi:MAG: histidine kinase [Clostridia bacterium]|nr:histidine kinase [Clostridia bacterium]